MKNGYISLVLLLNFILSNSIISMCTYGENIKNKELHLLKLPNEILLKIVQHVIESHINYWDGITNWQIIKKSIIEDLYNIFLACRYFDQFNNQKDIDYVINPIKGLIKSKISRSLENTRIKNLKLIKILDKYCFIEDKDYKRIINLIHAGADINVKNQYGYTALIRASSRNHKNIVKLLIELGADVNMHDDDRYTALMCAATYGCTAIAKLLINKGADINAINNQGQTALICATIACHKEIVELLIDNGADINVNSEKGNTALTLALEAGHSDIIILLINRVFRISCLKC